MNMKMNELIKLTQTSKSTILYYVKEGILPQPKKPKPNLHLYDESCVDAIAFIKYLQKNFDCSISQIKAISDEGGFNFENGFERVFETLDTLMGSAHQHSYTNSYVLQNYGITQETLDFFLKEEILFKRDDAYTQKELEILEILLDLEKIGVELDVMKAYVSHARELAKFEVQFTKKFLANSENKNRAAKALLDTTLILKPYIFNMHTLKAYQEGEK